MSYVHLVILYWAQHVPAYYHHPQHHHNSLKGFLTYMKQAVEGMYDLEISEKKTRFDLKFLEHIGIYC